MIRRVGREREEEEEAEEKEERKREMERKKRKSFSNDVYLETFIWETDFWEPP